MPRENGDMSMQPSGPMIISFFIYALLISFSLKEKHERLISNRKKRFRLELLENKTKQKEGCSGRSTQWGLRDGGLDDGFHLLVEGLYVLSFPVGQFFPLLRALPLHLLRPQTLAHDVHLSMASDLFNFISIISWIARALQINLVLLRL